jgi:hypothetical protein
MSGSNLSGSFCSSFPRCRSALGLISADIGVSYFCSFFIRLRG